MRHFHSIAFPMLAAAITAGCGAGSQERAAEYMPDMVRDPAYKAFAPNPATRDGLTLRMPVAGTIPRGYQAFHYGTGEEEAIRAGRELHNPYSASARTIVEGKALYETYCMVCHGRAGKGDGPVAEKIPHPPSYLSDPVIKYPPGRIFHIVTMGSKRMPSYAAQLSASDRWKVVTYVRGSLQHLADAEADAMPGAGK
jgi:mono/diheme cytochrome c family protein